MYSATLLYNLEENMHDKDYILSSAVAQVKLFEAALD